MIFILKRELLAKRTMKVLARSAYHDRQKLSDPLREFDILKRNEFVSAELVEHGVRDGALLVLERIRDDEEMTLHLIGFQPEVFRIGCSMSFQVLCSGEFFQLDVQLVNGRECVKVVWKAIETVTEFAPHIFIFNSLATSFRLAIAR